MYSFCTVFFMSKNFPFSHAVADRHLHPGAAVGHPDRRHDGDGRDGEVPHRLFFTHMMRWLTLSLTAE